MAVTVRSSETHQQAYHQAVLLFSCLLQHTAKAIKIIQVLLYHINEVFPVGKALKDKYKKKLTLTSVVSALKKKSKTPEN